MKSTSEFAGAETIGAILLFGIFVTVIAFLNVTAVPNAGIDAEGAHHDQVLAALNKLQSDAEAAASANGLGAATAMPLSPERGAGSDFFSFFLAQPARSVGEVAFVSDYGNLTLSHISQGGGTIADVGGSTVRFPLGRLTFDPHPAFRNPGVVQLEGGGIVTTDLDSESMRFSPPVSLSVSGSTTHVTVLARVLNGTDANLGGTGNVRLRLATESTSLSTSNEPNAVNVTLRLETEHGRAWGNYLNETSRAAGLTPGAGYATSVQTGAGEDGLDVVSWRVEGVGNGNDIRLTSGLTIYQARLT